MSRITAAIGLLLAIHVGVAGWVHHNDPQRAFAPDSPSYEKPALALLADGRFATEPGSDKPEIHRTPGYPMLIAASYALFDRVPALVIAIQISMHGMILALVARIARRVGAAAEWTALAVLGLSVTFFATAQYLLAETFFTLQVVLFSLLWIEMRRSLSKGSRYFALALATGLVLATMALTRPIAYYLPAVAAAVTALVAWRDGLTTRRVLASAAVLLIPAVVILGTWQVRNYRVSGSAEFSQMKNVNLLKYRAAGVVAQRDGIPLEDAQAQLYDDIERRYPDLEGARFLDAAGAEARRILRAEPLLTARDAAEGFARMMLLPGENGLLHLLGVDQPTGPAGDLLRLDFPSFVRKWVLGRPGEFLLFAFALAHLVTMYGLAAVALWRLPCQGMPARTIVVAGVVLIAYFALLSSGPEAYPRFRAPIVPLLAILAGVGAQNLTSMWARPRHA